MAVHVPLLAADLHRNLADEGADYDLIISHYWDAASIEAPWVSWRPGS